MTIAFVEATPVIKRKAPAAFIEYMKNRSTPAKARKAELANALRSLAPLVDDVGPSIRLTGAQAKEVTLVAKSIGLVVVARAYTGADAVEGERQVWVKGPVSA